MYIVYYYEINYYVFSSLRLQISQLNNEEITMYLLNVSYSKTPEEVAVHADTHSTWVKKNLEEGTFLFAGPKKSKLGGTILVKSIDKNKLMKIIAEDSFVTADVADYQIIDFDCKLTNPQLEILKAA